jgi:predicted ester cyclase
MSTTNTDMARRLIAAYDAGDETVVDDLIHPQHRDHGPDEEGLGRDAVRESMRWVGATFGDRETEIEDLFATDDRVVARVRFAATQIGELPMGLPPTGRRLETEHVHIWRVTDGQLAEHWMLRDDVGMLRQLQR